MCSNVSSIIWKRVVLRRVTYLLALGLRTSIDRRTSAFASSCRKLRVLLQRKTLSHFFWINRLKNTIHCILIFINTNQNNNTFDRINKMLTIARQVVISKAPVMTVAASRALSSFERPFSTSVGNLFHIKVRTKTFDCIFCGEIRILTLNNSPH